MVTGYMIAQARHLQLLVLDDKWDAFVLCKSFNHLTGATRSQRPRPPFACSDPHRFFHFRNKDFSIADLAGLGRT
jgi:hypothetical protein